MNPLARKIEELEQERELLQNGPDWEDKYDNVITKVKMFCNECMIQKNSTTICMQCFLYDLRVVK